MNKFFNLILLFNTVKNFHIVLIEYLFPQSDGFLKLYTRKKQTILCRKGTTDFHEVISVLSGREYPLEKLNLPQKPVIINIGAHIGTFDLFVKQKYKKAQIYSFEPNPSNFLLLNKNIKINKLQNIYTFNTGVSSKDGKCKLFFEDSNPNEGNIYSGNNPIEINTLTLASILKKNKLKKVDLLKIDCEGCEYDILKNLTKKIPIQYMAIEYHEISSQKCFKELTKELSPIYKTIYHKHNKELLSGILLLERKYDK